MPYLILLAVLPWLVGIACFRAEIEPGESVGDAARRRLWLR